MTKRELDEVWEQIVNWPAEDQEKLARFVIEIERWACER